MNKDITSTSIDIPKVDLKISYEVPNKCPMCGTAYAEAPLTTLHHVYKTYNEARFASVFFCPVCNDFFFDKALLYDISTRYPADRYPLDDRYAFPIKIETTVFPAEIKDISPSFIEIYNQAEYAEHNNLKHLVGMGYRKALEFLIKDYLCDSYPEEKDQILVKPLGKCIEEYIKNDDILALAKGSAWLGNDETHYVKLHQDKTVEDLKRFINALVYFIKYEVTVRAAKEMITNKDSDNE